jgi:LacI family transcriptional regulator
MSKIPRVILLIESSRAAGRALLCGIAQYAHHHGPWSFYWETRGLEAKSPGLLSAEADGVIMRDTEAVEAVRAWGLPMVVVAHRHAEVPGAVNVITDSETIGRMGAEHLAACGMRQFAFCGYTDCSWSDIRRDAFVKWLKTAEFPAETLSVRAEVTGAPWGNQRQAIASWLRSLRRPLGLMACNDDLGHEVIAACKLAGFDVPDDVAVVGADNDEVVCGLADPPLSSVAINFERAGYEAAEALTRLMGEGRQPNMRIQVRATHVVPRRSTDTLAVDDPSLAKALRFIRDRAHGGVSVGEVAQASGVSRRALEKRFRGLLGRSVLHEIRRLRADQIARLLVETDLPVAEIANRLGFADVQHVARYFRAAKQVSPLAYRKTLGHKQAQPAP